MTMKSKPHCFNGSRIQHGSNFLSVSETINTILHRDKMQEERCVNGNDNVGQLTMMRFDNISSSSVICVIFLINR